MKIAGAIVTNRGGRTCHAEIISRELGIPCVIGTGNGTEVIKHGANITIDCSEGVGRIYNGLMKFHVDEIKLDQLPTSKTMIMMNVGVPEQAFQQGQIPNYGVGLAREEFVINSYIGLHPLALLEYLKLKKKASKDKKIAEVIKKIDERSASYDDKVEFFVDNLARGIAKIAAGFYPNDVIARMPYNRSKILGEELCKGYYQDYGVQCVILRPFNIYGIGQAKDFLIPSIIDQLPSRKISLENPNPKRDYVFIDDVISLI